MIFKRGLEIMLDDGHTRTKTTLCGWKPGKYLLLEEPTGRTINESSSMIGRLFKDGAYYGFNVETLGHLPEAHVLAVKYPADIIESTVRKGSRLEVAIPANVSRDGAAHTDPGSNALITDLSAGGLNFVCFMLFNVGDTVTVAGALAPEHVEKPVRVLIKNTKALGNKYDYGGEFVFSDPGDATTLKAKVEKLGVITHGKVEEDPPPPTASQIVVPVGARMQFQIGVSKIISTLRGSSRKFLFIDTPLEKGKPVFVARNTMIFAKYAASGMGYAFETEIMRQYTAPAPLWALTHPGATRSMPLRKNSRLHTLIPAVIETGTGMLEGAIIDLSENGALFMADGTAPPTETSIILNFVLPTGKPVDNINSQVRNARGEDGKIYVGLSFDGHDPAKLAPIKAYCDSCSKFLE